MARFGEGSAVGRDEEKHSRRAVAGAYVTGGALTGAGVAAGANQVRRSANAQAETLRGPVSLRETRLSRAQVKNLTPLRRNVQARVKDKRSAEAVAGAMSPRELGAFRSRSTKAKNTYLAAHSQMRGRNYAAIREARGVAIEGLARRAKKAKIAMGVGAAIPVAAAATAGLVSHDWRRNPPAAKPKHPLLRDLKVKADRAGLSVAEDKAARSSDWDAFAAAKRRRNGL